MLDSATGVVLKCAKSLYRKLALQFSHCQIFKTLLHLDWHLWMFSFLVPRLGKPWCSLSDWWCGITVSMWWQWFVTQSAVASGPQGHEKCSDTSRPVKPFNTSGDISVAVTGFPPSQWWKHSATAPLPGPLVKSRLRTDLFHLCRHICFYSSKFISFILLVVHVDFSFFPPSCRNEYYSQIKFLSTFAKWILLVHLYEYVNVWNHIEKQDACIFVTALNLGRNKDIKKWAWVNVFRWNNRQRPYNSLTCLVSDLFNTKLWKPKSKTCQSCH